MLSYTWANSIGDIGDTIAEHCRNTQQDPKRTCTCANRYVLQQVRLWSLIVTDSTAIPLPHRTHLGSFGLPKLA